MKTFLKQLNHVPHFLGLILLLLLFCLPEAQATHLRGGEITAMRDTTPNPNPRRLFFKMVIYTDRSSQAEDLTVNINYGDGTRTTIPRGPVQYISPETDQQVVRWEHTFPADGTYTVSWIGVNRNGRILNMQAPSDAHSFYLAITINISSFRGFNSTPVLKIPPIDVANVGRVFVHNAGAFDPDGDSLAYRLVTPRGQAPNSTSIINIPGYTLPHNTFSCLNSTSSSAGSFTLNAVTGQMVWDAPCRAGEYTVAFVVEEWRRTPAGVVKIGEVLRDMQILVKTSPNRPPVLAPKDTCIVAGTTLNGFIRAYDPDNDLIRLVASGGMFPAASFIPGPNNTSTRGMAVGNFSWSPTCADVRAQPYQVLFRAEDIRSSVTERLVDVQPWNIKVVAPAPQQLTVARQGSNIQLSWNSYECQSATIQIYRRADAGSYVPDQCSPGIPASSGFKLVGEVAAGATTFLDTNNGQGLSSLRQYCYQIVASFPLPAGGKSMASAAACARVTFLSSEKETLEKVVQVYPNPAKGWLQVNLAGTKNWDIIRIFNTSGMLLLELHGNGQDHISMELPQRTTGLHLVQVQTPAGTVTKRVMLE